MPEWERSVLSASGLIASGTCRRARQLPAAQHRSRLVSAVYKYCTSRPYANLVINADASFEVYATSNHGRGSTKIRRWQGVALYDNESWGDFLPPFLSFRSFAVCTLVQYHVISENIMVRKPDQNFHLIFQGIDGNLYMCTTIVTAVWHLQHTHLKHFNLKIK